jgi:peptide-methionine (S)-S-oxide reductase
MRYTFTFLALICSGMAIATAGPAMAQTSSVKTETAIFAGGCFWCLEPPFDQLKGVISTTSGYTAGQMANPTYQQVSSGQTGHTEAVQVVYDPAQVSYEKLLEVFWRNHDPLTANAQFCDVGSQYRAGIYPLNESQRKAAEQSRKAIEQSARFSKPVVTEIKNGGAFYPAEDYHQDYYIKNPIKYKYYRSRCGRDDRLQELWGQ